MVAACRRGRRVRPDWAALQLQGCVSRTGARADWNQVVVVPLSLKVPVLAPIVERCCLHSTTQHATTGAGEPS